MPNELTILELKTGKFKSILFVFSWIDLDMNTVSMEKIFEKWTSMAVDLGNHFHVPKLHSEHIKRKNCDSENKKFKILLMLNLF